MEAQIQTLTKEKFKIEEPSKYNVVFLNDEITTFQFVVKVLMQIFHKTTEQAEALAKHIHDNGKGIVGTYLYEIAEQKGIETTILARDNGFPLQVKVQKDI